MDLPNKDFEAYWNAIHVPQHVKDTLLSQAILNFTLRPQVDRARIPLHGIILLVGVPGTGKTSLAKGLADRIAHAMNSTKITFLEVEPHSLGSHSLGRTQKAVTELFSTTIAEYAAKGPTFVLLDEVETLVVDRSKLSLDANPIDVHWATDAALVQLDHLAESHPNLLFVATSNFPKAIDGAFRSRCDLILEVPLPDEAAVKTILKSTLEALGEKFPKVTKIIGTSEHEAAARACVGLDGRQIRKVVVSACTFDRKTALDPNLLTGQDLIKAAKHAHSEGTK